MQSVSVRIEIAITNFQHIRVIPVSRARNPFQPLLKQDSVRYVVEPRSNIASRTPHIRADPWSPSPEPVIVAVTDAEHHGPTRRPYRVDHLFVDARELLPCKHIARTADIVFDEVEAPTRV